jgi:hypothetical protein
MRFWKIGYRKNNKGIFIFRYNQFESYENALEALEDLKKTNFSDKVEAKIFFVSECSEGIVE